MKLYLGCTIKLLVHYIKLLHTHGEIKTKENSFHCCYNKKMWYACQ